MQTTPGDNVLWQLAEKVAEQGLLFSVLVGILIGLYMRKIAWGWQIEEYKAMIGEYKSKLEAVDAEREDLLEIIRTNTKTTGDAVAGFNRALEELERITQRKWIGEKRRTGHGD